MPLAKVAYKQYPPLSNALQERNAVYNPLKPVDVGRMEKDTAKLRALYQEGYDIAEEVLASAQQ